MALPLHPEYRTKPMVWHVRLTTAGDIAEGWPADLLVIPDERNSLEVRQDAVALLAVAMTA